MAGNSNRPQEPWATLGLDGPPAEERDVKRAYAAKLKLTRPDDDPEGFTKLREAYDRAKRGWQWMREEYEREQAADEAPNEIPNEAPNEASNETPNKELAEAGEAKEEDEDEDDWDDGWREDDISTWFQHMEPIPRTWAQRVEEQIQNPPKPWGSSWDLGAWEQLLEDEALESLDGLRDLEPMVRNHVLTTFEFWDAEKKDALAVRFKDGFSNELLVMMNERFDWINKRGNYPWERDQYDFLRRALAVAGVWPDESDQSQAQFSAAPKQASPPQGRLRAVELRLLQREAAKPLQLLDIWVTWAIIAVGMLGFLAIFFDGQPPEDLPKWVLPIVLGVPVAGFFVVIGRSMAFFVQSFVTRHKPWLSQWRATMVGGLVAVVPLLMVANLFVFYASGGETERTAFSPVAMQTLDDGIALPFDPPKLNRDPFYATPAGEFTILSSTRTVEFDQVLGQGPLRSGWQRDRYGPAFEGVEHFGCAAAIDSSRNLENPSYGLHGVYCRLYLPINASFSLVNKACLEDNPFLSGWKCSLGLELPTLVVTASANGFTVEITRGTGAASGEGPDASRQWTRYVDNPFSLLIDDELVPLPFGQPPSADADVQSTTASIAGVDTASIRPRTSTATAHRLTPEQANVLLSGEAISLVIEVPDGVEVYARSPNLTLSTLTGTYEEFQQHRVREPVDRVVELSLPNKQDSSTVLRGLFPQQIDGPKPSAEALRQALVSLNARYHEVGPIKTGLEECARALELPKAVRTKVAIEKWIGLDQEALNYAPAEFSRTMTDPRRIDCLVVNSYAWKFKEFYRRLIAER